MRQRVHLRGVDRQRGVEQMGELDTQRLRHQPKEIAVAVDAPWPPLLDDLQPRFVLPVEDLAAQLTAGRSVDEFHRVRADPAGTHHRHQGIGHDAAHCGRRLQVFKLHADDDTRSRAKHPGQSPAIATRSGLVARDGRAASFKVRRIDARRMPDPSSPAARTPRASARTAGVAQHRPGVGNCGPAPDAARGRRSVTQALRALGALK